LPRKKAPEVKAEVTPRVFLTPSQVESIKTHLEPLRIDLLTVCNRLSTWKIGNQVEGGRNDYGAILKWVIDAVIRENPPVSTEHLQKNKDFVKVLEKKFSKEISKMEVVICYDRVEFLFGPYIPPQIAKLDSPTFINDCKHWLHKMHKDVTNL
jgi:branched-subunit amino acid transport protein AzlD